ncbi:dipeptide epimerase [Aeoliella mucimassa]|uniref:Dipeptide epimerase n=1 Tax=Aeoliella mucimassa TaxID=2527972 RepID=A0A518AP66_9BACT|nr:dipeptide epimerase [Aeoliella mucimassa]QDU56515.1 L-Ala-D/L-Glu epimerase [Aeoliella mucimassa]
MKLNVHRWNLPLKAPFRIAHSVTTHQATLVIELEHEGVRGLGEVGASTYYGHTIESLQQSVESVRSLVEAIEPTSGDDLWNALHSALAHDVFALSALDMACHDLVAKRAEQPWYAMQGLEWNNTVQSSWTIGIDTPEAMLENLQSHPGWSCYKVKLGSPHDMEVMALLRANTDELLRVDANAAWTVDDTLRYAEQLATLGVEFIEQPLPPTATREEHLQVFRNACLPIIADESCCTEEHVEPCLETFHGINVKLCKCGGLTPALRMLRQARRAEATTMVGCMLETSIGISAAAQLLPLLDCADLDGALLLGRDPADGVSIDCGRVTLSPHHGCGADWQP